MEMNKEQRLQLQSMIQQNNVSDQTSLIRELKHSSILREEANLLIQLKDTHKNDIHPSTLHDIATQKCQFLYKYYTDIFNKIKKDELDMNIFDNFLDILEKVENGSLSQHEASFQVGSILKSMYIDSAVKRADKLDQKEKMEKEKEKEKEKELNENTEPHKNISWKHFKKIEKIKNRKIK